MADQHLTPGDRRSSEPEIIPPGQDGGNETETGDPIWSLEEHGIRRIYVTKVGPLGFLPFAMLGVIVTLALLAFLFGFLLILLPVAGLVAAAAIIGSFFRRPR